MTAQDHNNIIGTLLLIFGGTNILVLVPIAYQLLARSENLLFVLFLILCVFSFFSSIFQVVAGFGLLKHKPWARASGVLAGIVSLIIIPVGTALGIYTLWFLYSEKAKEFYGQSLTATPPQPPKF